MRDDLPDGGAARDVTAEVRALIDETRRAIETSQSILDRCAAPSGEGPAAAARDGDEAALGEISDGLLHAYRFAQEDGDRLTVTLIERALFHVGRRLAAGLTPAEAGLSCH